MKVLIIAPHIDDEVLGCSAFLNENAFVLYCGVQDRKVISKKGRLIELESVKKESGFEYSILNDTKENEYELFLLLGHFEEFINYLSPDMVLIPHPSYNQDHRTVYEAAFTALRPHDENFFVKKVLVYEQPHTLFWRRNVFGPNYFVEVDIKRKIKLYELMPSQVRSFRGQEHLEAMAVLRGGQSNMKYAESYEILRWID